MEKMKKLCELIESELSKIAEKGLTTSNLETAYKLVDMYKDIKNTEYWETKGEYYDTVLAEMQGGYSQNDGYSMNDGGYSMYDRYMDAKQSYRSNQSMDGKQKLMESLEDYMDDFTEKIKEMHRDAETGEERELISKFMTKLQNIR